ncbi:MAG: hypothetical protein HOM91_02955 [Tateyamaria sp.]|jgi:hypothetical protein|nr:hypothetical protein [Tateyamaria sp.]
MKKSIEIEPHRKTKCKDARQQLQDKGLVVIDGSMGWINRSVEEIMEPYSDSED